MEDLIDDDIVVINKNNGDILTQSMLDAFHNIGLTQKWQTPLKRRLRQIYSHKYLSDAKRKSKNI